MLIGSSIFFGSIFGFKIFGNIMMNRYFATMQAPPVTVSAKKLTYQSWQPKIRATGSLSALMGVDVTTEVSGIVRKVHFTSGSMVQEGDILVELNDDSDVAHLKSLEAIAKLAEISYLRDKEQYIVKAVSKAAVDAGEADFKSKEAQVLEQKNIVAKKTIRAPFSGRIGITTLNEGDFVGPGTKMVSLQVLDPIYVDFYVPQQYLSKVAMNKAVSVNPDSFSDKSYSGTITALDSIVDPKTRNIHVQAILLNPEKNLLPGMFVAVQVFTGGEIPYLTLPQSAISYNPYGELVFIVNETGKDKDNTPILTVKETFVTVGETRGDQVAIIKGLKEGDEIVTSGQMKLKNGSQVIIDNTQVPSDDPVPDPVDE